MKIEVAVIPAAGLGTRMLPATKAVPKELLPLGTRPAIEHIIEEAVKSGIKEVVLVTARGKEGILDHFDRHRDLENALEAKGAYDLLESVRYSSDMVKVIAIRQGLPLGLGHAVLQSEPIVKGRPFAVLLPDDIIDADKPALVQLIENKGENGSIAVMEVSKQEVSRYGIISGRKLSPNTIKISQMLEKPSPQEAPSNLAIIGRYVLSPEIFSYLNKIPKGKGGEIQLTDAIQAMINDGFEINGVIFEGKRYDTGNPAGYIEASVAYALKTKYAKDIKVRLKKLFE